MIISAIEVKRINFENAENLRRLFLQLLNNPCGKITFDMQGIDKIDRPAIDMLDKLNRLANKHNVLFEYINVSEKIKLLFEASGLKNNVWLSVNPNSNKIRGLN